MEINIFIYRLNIHVFVLDVEFMHVDYNLYLASNHKIQIKTFTSNSNIYTVMANLHRCYEHEKFHFLAAFGWNLCEHYMASTTDENIYVLFMYFTYLYMLNYTQCFATHTLYEFNTTIDLKQELHSGYRGEFLDSAGFFNVHVLCIILF